MFPILRWVLVTACCLVLPVAAGAQDAKPPADNPALASAEHLRRSGQLAEAEASYRTLVKADPNLVAAQTGLVASLLKQQKVDEALEAVKTALETQPSSPALLAARGDVQFRLADMEGAESSYSDAKMLDRKDVHAHLGLARLYRAQSMYGKANVELLRARDLAPNDPDVQQAWFDLLPRRERLAAMEAYLSGPHADNDEATQRTADAVEFLKQTIDQPVHACKLESKVEKTEAPLDLLKNALGIRSGINLKVLISGRTVGLQLDTGASGILLSRRMAERLGLKRISAAHFAGIGDHGPSTGYMALADRIQVGALDFRDCVVGVVDKFSDSSQDGLIGTDVFADYLVEVDVPGSRLALSPLPKRPTEPEAATYLHSPGDERTAADQQEAGETTTKSGAPADRYIAADMSRWTQVFRFGHQLLVPTSVNDAESKLFLLDTGAFDNILAERTGHQVGKVKNSFGPRITGLSGDVKKAFHTKVDLRVGHLQQSNLDITTLNLSDISAKTGTEVSGLLGFVMLQMLDVKIDYRDGLVQMTFDPKRVQQLMKP